MQRSDVDRVFSRRVKLTVVVAALGSWLLTPLFFALSADGEAPHEVFVIILAFGVPGLVAGLAISCPLIIFTWRRLFPPAVPLFKSERAALVGSVVVAGLVGNGATSLLGWLIVEATGWNVVNIVVFALLAGTPVALLIAPIAAWRAYNPQRADA
ncbi:MAG: hypothetical protein AAF322_07510 [Pseudomonadota bacterium]